MNDQLVTIFSNILGLGITGYFLEISFSRIVFLWKRYTGNGNFVANGSYILMDIFFPLTFVFICTVSFIPIYPFLLMLLIFLAGATDVYLYRKVCIKKIMFYLTIFCTICLFMMIRFIKDLYSIFYG